MPTHISEGSHVHIMGEGWISVTRYPTCVLLYRVVMMVSIVHLGDGVVGMRALHYPSSTVATGHLTLIRAFQHDCALQMNWWLINEAMCVVANLGTYP